MRFAAVIFAAVTAEAKRAKKAQATTPVTNPYFTPLAQNLLATVAVVFGFAHAPNVSGTRPRVVYTISATIAGLIFARACAATGGGLLAPVIAHCAHNCVAGFVTLSDVADASARISERGAGQAPAAA